MTQNTQKATNAFAGAPKLYGKLEFWDENGQTIPDENLTSAQQAYKETWQKADLEFTRGM